MREGKKKYAVFLLFMLIMSVPLSLLAQINQGEKKVTLNLQKVSAVELFRVIHQQTNLSFVYNVRDLADLNQPITVQATNESVSSLLQRVFKNEHVSFEFVNNTIVVKPKRVVFNVRGCITDGKTGDPLPGANVRVEGTSQGAVTDADGRYNLSCACSGQAVLVYSFVGYDDVKKVLKGNQIYNVSLQSSEKQLGEVVVTGIYNRKAESYTGSATTISSKDIMRVSNQNVFQSLKNLDPTIYIPDNLTMGSDPNTVPTMSMRGTSSFPGTTTSLKSNYQNQPNQPLFILDGFETSAENIMDMDMNRIESITILKDASAKALYGSKAANGVVVIETKRLAGNQQRVTYNGSLSFEAPDLTSYDLCNASEKLQVEQLEGMYTSDYIPYQESLSKRYNARKKLVLEGLDTYWLSKPLHTGVGQKHNLNIELGDSRSLRAYLDFTYNDVKGVMKGSDRRNISGDVNISYRYNNILFKNILTIVSNKGSESPYGSFSDYAKMNPYWQAKDDNGNILQWVEKSDGESEKIANPMYDATIGTSLKTTYLQFTNNFYAEWQMAEDWKATWRVGVSQKRNDADSFYPALHSMFVNYSIGDDLLKRGKYIMENGKMNSISSDLNLNFNKIIGKHTIFADAGFFISEDKSQAYQHTATGFANNQTADITFARQYAEGITPVGYSTINRQASFLLAASYDYANRYLMDVTVRESASSLYGSDNRWANSWSFGVGWNLHNEKFMQNLKWVKQLKLRASVGITGNQNFDTNAAIATYKYYSGVVYTGNAQYMTGAYLSNMPNNQLKWEQKKDYDAGIDLRLAGLSMSFDYYSADTKNMLTDVTIPTSTGFSSVKDNLGLVRNSGFEVKANYTLWHGKQGFVNVYGTLAYNKNKIVHLSESMKSYNETMKKLAESTTNSTPVLIYEDGLSMSTIWAVPSAGIDPQTGREIYIKKDGTYTYQYSSSDLVPSGDSSPKYRGTAGFSAEYKGFGLSATMNFLTGCKLYNYTLVDRVENADITYNVDRRVLLGRWQRPGDVTKFKKFQSDEVTRATQRFVQNRRELTLSQISAYYEFPATIYRKLAMQRLRLSFYTNDLVTFSSIKVERGLTYPFARNFSIALTGTF